VQRRAERLGSTEEDTCFCGRMDLANGLEDHVPVGATEVCGCAETSDGVLLGVGVIDHDVSCVVGLDLGSEVLDVQLMVKGALTQENILQCEFRCGSRDPVPQWQVAKT
jgi:hypothetical protein